MSLGRILPGGIRCPQVEFYGIRCPQVEVYRGTTVRGQHEDDDVPRWKCTGGQHEDDHEGGSVPGDIVLMVVVEKRSSSWSPSSYVYLLNRYSIACETIPFIESDVRRTIPFVESDAIKYCQTYHSFYGIRCHQILSDVPFLLWNPMSPG